MFPLKNIYILWKMFTFRFWKKQPATTIIIGLIIALGVATFLSIRMANRAAISNFALFSDVITDGSDWVIQSTSGILTTEDLQLIRRSLQDEPVAILPIIETTIRPVEIPAGQSQRSYRLIASDIFALRNFLHSTGKTETTAFGFNPQEETEAIRGIITPDIATAYQLQRGDLLPVFLQDETVPLHIAGIFSDAVKEEQSLNNLFFTDIRRLQEKLNLPQVFHRVELVIPDGYDRTQLVEKVGSLLAESAPSHWSINRLEESNQETLEMTQAFRLNLIVLSLISLLVCVFLILQGLDASVVRRRKEIATLRSLGMSRREIQISWLFESLILGLLGSVVGVVLGGLLAQLLVGQIANTVNTLYRTTSVESASMRVDDVVLGFSIGVILSLISGYLPSKDAASTPPAQILSKGNTSHGLVIFKHRWIGVVALGLAAIFYFAPAFRLPSGNPFPIGGYASAFLAIIGTTWLAIYLFRPVSWVFLRLSSQNAVWMNGISRLRLGESRQKLAVAGLVIAISMAGGMSVLVSSFERSMLKWVDYTFDADVFISSKSAASGDAFNRITQETFTSLETSNGVDVVIPYAQYPIQFEDRQTFIAGTVLNEPLKWEKYIWISRPAGNPFLTESNACIINESLSNHFGVGVNDTLRVSTPDGDKSLKVVGIHSDYTSDRGLITIPIDQLYDWYRSDNVTNLSIYLDAGIDTQQRIADYTAAYPGLNFLSNQDLRFIIQKIFRDTFAVTQSIQWLGLFIAVAGLALSLFCILLENRSNLQLYSELGMSRNEIARTTAVEGLGLSSIGLVGGLLLSLFLGSLLIFVINKQSFGWTLQYYFPWMDLLLFSSLILLIGYGVSFWIGYKHTRISRIDA